MTALNIGDKAPDFEIITSNQQKTKLSDFRGKFVVLYFYPKDDTTGCTIEAKGFNQLKSEFTKNNAIIIGLSKDDLDSHQQFKDKYCIEFDLATDKDSDTCEQYGVWIEKSMDGKSYMGIDRTTFLINTAGNIAQIWRNVAVNNHAAEVLKAITD